MGGGGWEGRSRSLWRPKLIPLLLFFRKRLKLLDERVEPFTRSIYPLGGLLRRESNMLPIR